MLKKVILLTFFAFFAEQTVTASTVKPTTVECGDQGDCITNAVKNCSELCGCDQFYYYNYTLETCVFNYQYFYETITQKYNFPEKIDREAQKAFDGIMISVIFFVTCCAALFLSACLYCCRIDYTDNKLKNDVEALRKKLKRDGKFTKSMKKKEVDPLINENCTMIAGGEPGVFVV